MEEYKLRLLYAGLTLAAFVLLVGVLAGVLNLAYASQIIVAALTAIGFLIRAIVRNLEPDDRKRHSEYILSKEQEIDSSTGPRENRRRRKLLQSKEISSTPTLSEDANKQLATDSEAARPSKSQASNPGMAG
jgi:hypothetical protein